MRGYPGESSCDLSRTRLGRVGLVLWQGIIVFKMGECTQSRLMRRLNSTLERNDGDSDGQHMTVNYSLNIESIHPGLEVLVL